MLNCLQTTVQLFHVTLFYMVWNLHVCLAGADVAAGLLGFGHWSLLLGWCKLQVAGCRSGFHLDVV